MKKLRLFLVLIFILASACGTTTPVTVIQNPSAPVPAAPAQPGQTAPGQGTPLPVETPATPEPSPEPERPTQTTGVVEEIRRLTERGVPSSLNQALDLIRSQNAGNTEFGRAMNGVIGTLLRTIYPASQARIPSMDLPQNNNYARILRNIEAGNYTPFSSSRDVLELILPFLALYNDNGRHATRERLLSAVQDLQRGAEINRDSVLAPFFLGIAYERAGMMNEALAQFNRAWELSAECYPAALGLARIAESTGRIQDAAGILSDLAIRYPDNTQVKRQLALVYYRAGDWSRAEPAIAEILQRDNRDGEFILMRAHVLVELGQFSQAQAPLDQYSSINANNRLYLFLRARVQFEGFRNRDAALNYLRSLLRNSRTIDDEASVYAATLLMESPRETDQSEGRSLLAQLLANPEPSLTVTALALQDAIRRESWTEARPFLTRLLSERRSTQDLLNAYTVEKGLGNNAAALSFARELYERDQSSDEGNIAYITALIDTGRQNEASRMVESRLGRAPSGVIKSRYYYLRSRTQRNEETVIDDLRNSLFEDPRNLNALIAMVEIYHRSRNERRVVFYLKQALALDPDNPLLKRYETEYAAALRTY